MATDDEIYDLADDGPPPPPNPLASRTARPPADASPLLASPPPIDAADHTVAGNISTLSYARPGTANSRSLEFAPPHARGAAADPWLARRERRRTRIVPMVLVVLGAIVVFGCAWGHDEGVAGRRELGAIVVFGCAWGITGNFAKGSAWAGVGVSWDVVIVLLGMLVGSRVVDLEAESILILLLQIAAIVLAEAAVFWPLMWLDRGAVCGMLVAWIASTLVYCCLLSYFFDLEINEVVVLAIVITVVRFAANVVWWQYFGAFGYLPM